MAAGKGSSSRASQCEWFGKGSSGLAVLPMRGANVGRLKILQRGYKVAGCLQQPASAPVTKHHRDIARLDRATAATDFWQGIFRAARWSWMRLWRLSGHVQMKALATRNCDKASSKRQPKTRTRRPAHCWRNWHSTCFRPELRDDVTIIRKPSHKLLRLDLKLESYFYLEFGLSCRLKADNWTRFLSMALTYSISRVNVRNCTVQK